VSAQSRPDGALKRRSSAASEKCAIARPDALAGGSQSPQGQVELAMEHLEELSPCWGSLWRGAYRRASTSDGAVPGGRARVRVDARDAGVPAQQLKSLHVSGDINGLTTQPSLALRLSTSALISEVPVNVVAQIQGPINAVALAADGQQRGRCQYHGSGYRHGNARYGQRTLRLSALELHYREQTARLLSPAVLSFGDA